MKTDKVVKSSRFLKGVMRDPDAVYAAAWDLCEKRRIHTLLEDFVRLRSGIN